MELHKPDNGKKTDLVYGRLMIGNKVQQASRPLAGSDQTRSLNISPQEF